MEYALSINVKPCGMKVDKLSETAPKQGELCLMDGVVYVWIGNSWNPFEESVQISNKIKTLAKTVVDDSEFRKEVVKILT